MTENKEKVPIFILANLPLHSALGKEEPFDLGYEAQKMSDDQTVQGIILISVLAYQFLNYFELIKGRWGEEIARIGKEHLFITLGRLNEATSKEARMGDQIKYFMNFIQEIHEKEPFTQEVDGKIITLSKEEMLALGILYGMEQSPYYAGNQRDGERTKKLDSDLDTKFSGLLLVARQLIFSKYSQFLWSDSIILDETDLSESSIAALRRNDSSFRERMQKIENSAIIKKESFAKRIFKFVIWIACMLWFLHLIWIFIFPR